MWVASENLFFALNSSPSRPHNGNLPIHLPSFYPYFPRLNPGVKAMPVHATDSSSQSSVINRPIGTVVSSSARAFPCLLPLQASKNPSLLSFSRTNDQQQVHRQGFLRYSSAIPSPFGVRHRSLFCQYCTSGLPLTICSSLYVCCHGAPPQLPGPR